MKKTQKPNLLRLLLLICTICIGTFIFDMDAKAATSGEIPCSEGQITWTLDDNGVLIFSGNGSTDIPANNRVWSDFWSNAGLVKTDVLSVKVDENSNIKLNTCGNMFRDFNKCTVIDMSGFDTSEVYDMSGMFYGCNSLTGLNIDDLKTENVTSMKEMFFNCYSLTELNVSGLDTSNVTNMWQMFSGCRNMTELNVSGFETGNVTDMGGMFSGCSKVTELDVSNFETGNVTDMSGMFFACSELTQLNVSSFETENVTDMSSMFVNCGKVTELDVSNFTTGNVTDMSSMFSGCDEVTELNVSGFETGKVTDMGRMFEGCNKVTKLDVSGFDTKNVTNMWSMFRFCTALTELNVSSFKTENTKNMSYMFGSCSAITELDVSGFETGNVTAMSNMFDNCRAVTKLNVSGFETGKVTDMSGMFASCYALIELNVSGLDTGSVTDMSSMFARCSALTELNISNFSTEKVTDMSGMFSGCGALTQLNISNFNTEKVTDMSGMFSGCSALIQLNVSSFETGNVTDMYAMFSDCSALTELNVSNFVTEKVTRMNSMFSGCSSLINLDVSGFDTTNVTNAVSFLNNNNALRKLHTPKTSLTVYLPSLAEEEVWVDHEKNIYSSAQYTFAKSTIIQRVGTTYNISYVTDGELIDCPTTYKVTEGIAVLGTAQANCKKFAGWYSDAQYTKPITAIEKGTFGDLTLYGKLDANHDIDRENGTIIKPATETEAGTIQYQCKNCTYTITEEIPKLSKEQDAATPDKEPETPSDSTESTIINTGENDVKGSSFAKIQARADKTTKNSIRLKWRKVKDADGYVIYGNRCGRQNKYEPLKTIKNGKTTSFTQKKLKKGKYYKYIVTAYREVNGEKESLAISKTIHAVTSGGKYGNAKSVKVNKTKVTLNKNKTFRLKTSEVAPKGKKLSKHRSILFESSDTSIATVTKKGVVKGKKKGTCHIYAYAQNGVYKKIKVKVK